MRGCMELQYDCCHSVSLFVSVSCDVLLLVSQEEAQARLTEILPELGAAGAFARIAREISECSSALKGGTFPFNCARTHPDARARFLWISCS